MLLVEHAVLLFVCRNWQLVLFNVYHERNLALASGLLGFEESRMSKYTIYCIGMLPLPVTAGSEGW